jgi:hypothetical protein
MENVQRNVAHLPVDLMLFFCDKGVVKLPQSERSAGPAQLIENNA